ncbi:MAG: hypothetical protein ACOYI5_11680 [Christensenellales bacterium]|jgi:hypothetical protein
MALFCMILGGAVFASFLFGGYVLASLFMSQNFWNILGGTAQLSVSDMFRLPTAQTAGMFITWILFMGFIGLMIGMGIFMNGLNYRKLERIERSLYRIARKQTRREE